MEKPMKNKLCLITGANSGIGKATTFELARQGAYVIMLCRDEDRAQKAREEIVKETGSTGVEVMLADFTYQYEIREVADQFNSKFEKLDVLINNAGMIPSSRSETIDGVEKTFAVNHLGPFLLTNLLLDRLLAAPQARIINVSSEVHRLGASIFHLANLQLEEGYSPMKAYGLSKLCNIMFTHELATRLSETAITANALHPGVVRTRLSSQAGLLTKLFYLIGKPFMKSPVKGAETPVYLATSTEVADISGKYFKNKKIRKPADIAFDDELTRKLWEISEELTKLHQHTH
jgi:NAD(P)-dependent dehydrogenase (short-subunit alcohol dehydrogenase family)